MVSTSTHSLHCFGGGGDGGSGGDGGGAGVGGGGDGDGGGDGGDGEDGASLADTTSRLRASARRSVEMVFIWVVEDFDWPRLIVTRLVVLRRRAKV